MRNLTFDRAGTDKRFDLRSSSVTTRHSSSKLGFALAAPSFVVLALSNVDRW